MTAKLERWSQAHITSVCVSLTRRHPDVDHLPLSPDYGRVRSFKCIHVHRLVDGRVFNLHATVLKYSWQIITTQVYILYVHNHKSSLDYCSVNNNRVIVILR